MRRKKSKRGIRLRDGPNSSLSRRGMVKEIGREKEKDRNIERKINIKIERERERGRLRAEERV